MSLSYRILQSTKASCPRTLDTLPPFFTDDRCANAYISKFMISNKKFDFYCVPCDTRGDYRSHDLVMGYIASEDTTLTIDYHRFNDTYNLKKGEFIWAFKKVSVFPTVAAQFTPDPIARGDNVYEIRCVLADKERRIVSRDSHKLTDEWSMCGGLTNHINDPPLPSA